MRIDKDGFVKMTRLEKKIYKVLCERPDSRKNDLLLYLIYARNERGEGNDYIRKWYEYGLATPESVVVTRRKLQRFYPECRADKAFERKQKEQAKFYRSYYRVKKMPTVNIDEL